MPYNGARNPSNTNPFDIFKYPKLGSNCESFAHATLITMGNLIPFDERASDFFANRAFLKKIEDRDVQTGDVLGFCRREKDDLYGAHMGVAVILHDRLYALHNAVGQGVVFQPLEEVQKNERYQNYAITVRPRVKAPQFADYNLLNSLGFWYLLPTESGR